MARNVGCKSPWLVGLLVLAVVSSHGNAIQCPQAIVMLLPCKDYLVGQSNSLTAQCCQGASALNGMIHGKPDLKDLCVCLKNAANNFHVIASRAKSLPDMCHIQVPVPMDPNIDCNAI